MCVHLFLTQRRRRPPVKQEEDIAAVCLSVSIKGVKPFRFGRESSSRTAGEEKEHSASSFSKLLSSTGLHRQKRFFFQIQCTEIMCDIENQFISILQAPHLSGQQKTGQSDICTNPGWSQQTSSRTSQQKDDQNEAEEQKRSDKSWK